jgi:DNA-binding LacI/PurR family transcriptional regulator
VRQPIVEKGRLAAALLVERMNGRAAISPAPLATRLVVRGSTSKRKEVVRPPAK